MNRRKLAKYGGRKKAIFGSQEAAILAAAGINVAGSLAAAGIGASAAKQAARDQANATVQAAQRQSQAIKEQSAKAKENMTEQQEFVKEQNAENRELQKDIQMQLAMLTGAQNVNDRLEASKITVKNGGRTKPRLSLRGGNMPFKVTDGGYVLPIGQTPEGFGLYEIRGDNHEHYHKTRGKYKSGVGIKFADGNVVEGEGNQNTNQGEYMLDTPYAAYFISKHNIAGFNPAKAINGGMHPLMAYNIQEQQKAINGITDDGKKVKSPRRKSMAGGLTPNLYDISNMTSPQVGTDTIGDTSVGVAYAVQSPDNTKAKFGGKKRCLKLGGRHKAYWGTDAQGRRIRIEGAGASSTTTSSGPGNGGRNSYYGQTIGGTTSSTTTPTSTNGGPGTGGRTGVNVYGGGGSNPGTMLKTTGNTTGGGTTRSTGGGFGSWVTRNADLLGAGIGALGNIGGAWITAAANRSAARTLADAQRQASDTIAEAYRNLQTIDLNTIKKEDYRAAHAMPALQAPVSFAARQIAGADRSLQRRLSNAGRYSASGAAAQQRMSEAEVATQDAKNAIYSEDQKQMQNIRQANAERVSHTALFNAQQDNEANKQYGDAMLKLRQYNNDIVNERILGSAGATAEGAINVANTMANAKTTGAQAWANALIGSTQGFTNAFTNMATRRADLEKVKLSANTDTLSSYYSNPGLTTRQEALNQYNRLKAQREQAIKNGDTEYARILQRQINNIASGRGFEMV